MSGIGRLRRSASRAYRRAAGTELHRLREQVDELAGEVHVLRARQQAHGPAPTETADIAMLTDMRLPGGTTASLAEEVIAQHDAGLTTALIHAQSGITSLSTGFSPHIRRVMNLEGVHLVSPSEPLRAGLLIIRHPKAMATAASRFPQIQAEQVVMVANHPAADAAGHTEYDVALADARARAAFGAAPVWAPISSVVRESLAQDAESIVLRAEDWPNIFGRLPAAGLARSPGDGVPVIGRHSRPQREKWPDTREDLLAAYPDADDVRVEILGGAEIPQTILGELPARWNVLPFGEEEPSEFLRRVDFWVFMHHPSWREAFGRAAMEALAAGCVVVLPPYLETVYGDAALYAEPHEVRGIVQECWDSPEMFRRQAQAGRDYVARYGPQAHLRRLTELGVVTP